MLLFNVPKQCFGGTATIAKSFGTGDSTNS